MITDVVTVQSSRVKTQIIKFKVQSSKFNVQRIKGFEKFVVVNGSYHKVQTSNFKLQRIKSRATN